MIGTDMLSPDLARNVIDIKVRSATKSYTILSPEGGFTISLMANKLTLAWETLRRHRQPQNLLLEVMACYF